jgi:hypothetical protein
MKALSTDCYPERSESPAKRAIRGVDVEAFARRLSRPPKSRAKSSELAPLSSLRALRARFSAALTLAVAALREIFDESAYQRFLVRRGLQPSPATYADFWSEHEKARARRPRCC